MKYKNEEHALQRVSAVGVEFKRSNRTLTIKKGLKIGNRAWGAMDYLRKVHKWIIRWEK